MAESDRARWNEKFEARSDALAATVPFIMEHVSALAPGARVLDLAAGDGRHSVALAKAGFSMSAVDVSDVGLSRLSGFAELAGVQIKTHRLDLEEEDALSGLGPFDGALISFYKPAPWLWHPLARAIPPGGRIVLATFNQAHSRATGFPLRYALEQDELLHPHPGMELRVYESLTDERGAYDGYVWERV
ncbi:MAG: methyltransferase domain-containing protein [Myxococcota bacterium]